MDEGEAPRREPSPLQRLAVPVLVGGAIGAAIRLWAQALYRPPGSYVLMPESALLVFAAIAVLAVVVMVGGVKLARPATKPTGVAILTAAGSSVVAWFLVGVASGHPV